MSKLLGNGSRCSDDLIPSWVINIQCALFAILWTFTMLPHVLFLRNTALILGAIIGIYVAIKRRNILITKSATPIVLIGLLFLWVTLHLFLIGPNSSLQWAEYQSLWKRAFLGVLFALGLGISLSSAKKSYWMFIFAGICGPMVIYYLKYCVQLSSMYFGWAIPEALVLNPSSNNSFYIPKTSYVFFCLPALAVALGYLLKLLKSREMNREFMFVYVATIMGVVGIFYLENIKNGFVYTSLLTLIFLASYLRGGAKAFSYKSYCMLSILGVAIFLSVFSNFTKNDSWKSLPADAKVALHTQPDEAWGKPAFEYPLNEYGNAVSPTNFDRLFYLKTSIMFIKQYPLGYGLVHSSFGHIARESFPYAPLIQSHSGWMDLALGLGIPGAVLLLAATVLAIFQISKVSSPWSVFGLWSLLSIALLLITTEVSQKNFIDTYVWLVVLVAGLGLRSGLSKS